MKKVVLLLLVSFFLISGLVMAANGNGNSTPEFVREQRVIVGGGDSLWGFLSLIEGRHEFDGHELIGLIREKNGLTPSDHLMVGQEIILPKEVR